jgi:uncharacterized glyoxalase superfamily protein PhnB
MTTHTLNGTLLTPSLTVDSVARSIDFYTALGFEAYDHYEQDGVLLGVMLKAGRVRIGLSQDDGQKGSDRVKGVGMRLYLETSDDIDTLAARAQAAGLTLTNEPYDTDWGTRAFALVDPTGFAITVSSPAPEQK